MFALIAKTYYADVQLYCRAKMAQYWRSDELQICSLTIRDRDIHEGRGLYCDATKPTPGSEIENR
jgi:hypothetical protein